MLRNAIEKLNEIKYPIDKLDQKTIIEEMIENTTQLLKELVPLHFALEDQPSPISPAPPPFYVPYRTNITESEIRNSTESDSTTFLSAKYLCNNTEYISETSNSLRYKALNISNPAKLFDLHYLNAYFKQSDIIKFQSTNRILIFHFIVVIFVVIITLIVFYFGSNDHFQKKNRLKMMNICKKQIIDIFDQILNVDKANKSLIRDKFKPVSKIFENLKYVIHEFQTCVELAQKFCDILDNEININKKNTKEPIKIHEIIEQDIQNNNITGNSHHFSDKVPNEIYLYSGKQEFNDIINSVVNVLSPNLGKTIFWDIIQVGDHSLIPNSMVNTIGEVSTGVKQVIDDNWNIISSNQEEIREYSFLTIDISPCMIFKNIHNEKKAEDIKVEENNEQYEVNCLLEALNCVTRSFHLLIAKRMANCVFGGVLICHGNFGDQAREFQVNELNYIRDITGNTLIIPIKKNQKNLLKSNSLIKSLSNIINPDVKIYTSGLDFKVSTIIKNISKILNIPHLEIECWVLQEKNDLVDYLLDKPGYWFIDTSIIHLISSNSNGKSFPVKQSPSKTHIIQEKKINCDYRQIIRLLNRPISEINENLFRDIGNMSQISGKDDSLIGSSYIKLVDIRELYCKQKMNKNSGKLKSFNDEKWDIRKPEILSKEWYNIDLLELSIDEIKEIAEFLIYYRFREVIRDKDDYDDDVLSWQINKRKIKNFVSELIKYYHEENPFHNFHHAVSISITLNNWLDKPSVRHYVNSLEAYCLIISSLSHDLDHPGLTNDMIKELNILSRKVLQEFTTDEQFFEILQNNTLSTLKIYNNFSVLENHHSSLLFVILNDEASNIMPPTTSKYYSELHKMMINSILFTDMFQHKYLRDLVLNFNKNYSSNSRSIEVEAQKKKLYLLILLHSVDISNPLMNTNIYLKWSRLVYEELENQKKLKLMLNISLNDTTDTYDYTKLQTSFISSICIPYFQALLKFDPEIVQECIQNLYFNNEYFAKTGQKTRTNK
ncbi:phosphdiesterase, possible [Cryptosporidium parvum]|uniref:Phosphdiesterase, possible n=1 Tax=Cryptosporidium parvum TaxID=5807 RepID=A0A7G2HJD0_CRYPV|nr:phosphdiesterase, possible [Cryptosporidium parvum]